MTMKNGMFAGTAVMMGLALAGVMVRAQSGDSPGVRGKALDDRVTERFRALDKDRDDRLTKTELGAGLFRELNVDGDNIVTLAEAQSEIRKRGFEAVLKAAQTIREIGTDNESKPAANSTPAATKTEAPPKSTATTPKLVATSSPIT